jgi:hypothetical protein
MKNMMYTFVSIVVIGLSIALQLSDNQLSDKDKKAIILELENCFQESCNGNEAGEIGSFLRERLREGAYESQSAHNEFAQAIENDLRKACLNKYPEFEFQPKNDQAGRMCPAGFRPKACCKKAQGQCNTDQPCGKRVWDVFVLKMPEDKECRKNCPLKDEGCSKSSWSPDLAVGF